MGCFCFPSPKTALLVTREPIETQNLSLLRQKVTLMENAITMLKSDQDTLMALLKKRQKKQQNQEELLQNHKQKQEKNYLQLSAITRTLEVKMDQEIKAIWAVLRGLEESVEANKNGLERTDSSEHLTPCWEFPFPVRPRSSSDWHEECVQYPCVQFATRGNIQNVTQRDISGVPPSGQRLHKRSHVLPPLVDPPVPIKHCFPDLSPTKRSLPLPHTVSKGINMDPCSDTAFRQQKDWMKTKEEERENDRVEILKAVEKEVERKWKKLQRNSPGRGFLEQEEMVDMMKAMEAKRVKERVEILQLAEKEFERKWLEMQNAGQKPKGDKSEVHFAEKELENNLKGQMKNIPKPLEEIKRDKAEKDLTLSEIFDEELQRAKERIKILDKLMRDNKMERKLRLEEEKKKEKERKENKIQEKLKLEEEKRKEREQFKVLEKEIKSKGLEEKRRFKEEKERIENLQKEKKVRLKQEKLRLEAEKRKEKEMAKTLKKEKKEKEIKEKT
ncbi:histone-lysine N-methyltransferase, H3 lysine-79 specific-like [Esox lucius]|uniref:histone-lysine N-methyltransferase, H3 lysine-79 specific-like n=1 Tax=Esox lucius TaxID=8010 RepID=UPI0014775E81|nr:histone-lysine N-methyltransferase, H3 lysine-79 specific-like [Esox lucius]